MIGCMDLATVWKNGNLFLAFLLDSNTTDYVVDLTRASSMMGKRLGTY